jgi:FAD/FMN-containing dehydrogenase/Fe-S oxidoreductase
MTGSNLDSALSRRTQIQESGQRLKVFQTEDAEGDRTSDSHNMPLMQKEQSVNPGVITVDAVKLEAALKAAGLQAEIRFDKGSRALYATDSSNYRQVPIGVVIPKTEQDIIRAVEICRAHHAPIVSRGGGTSLAGQSCNVAVVMDMSKYYNAILELNHEEKYAWVQPGIVLDELRNAAEKYNLTFAPDPATHNHCTIGGMIGNNSCGIHALMGGKTSENILELDILTYDGHRMTVGTTTDAELEQIISEGGRRGEIYKGLKDLRNRYTDLIKKKYPKIPRRVSGYNLDELLPEHNFDVAKALVGSEGTCVVILRAKTRLVPSPPVRSLLVLGYPDMFTAADHVPQVLLSKPIGLEGIDEMLVEYMQRKKLHVKDLSLLPPGRGWLVVEFGGETKEESDGHARACMERLRQADKPPHMKLYDDVKEESTVWKIRESGLGATARIPALPDNWPGWEDSAVSPEKLGGYLRDLDSLFKKYNYKVSLYGHFGQGCVHCRIPFDLVTPVGIQKFREFLSEASDLVLSYGGSLSGEHGDGQARAAMLTKMFGKELIEAFEQFKSLWDPEWKMNPGKIVLPNAVTANLRLGANYEPWQPKTHMQYPDDQNNFARVTTRCVGVGECRRHEGGTMCPSYMVTREEMHSTRGRSRLLFEMLEGNPLDRGWQDETVKEALDLCLACKGCKGDCPVNVDMATYKAEFLSHYFAKRIRPRSAYAFGLINNWARIATYVPNIVNFLTSAPGFSQIAKWLSGSDKSRKLPKFATRNFKEHVTKNSKNDPSVAEVILFADTFNNYFHVDTAKAAYEILQEAGFRVYVPTQPFCCGRPLYDFGMLKLAKRYLEDILSGLRPFIKKGVPIVILEPSCLSVFKDELMSFFPEDPDAQRLRDQTFLLSEFIQDNQSRFSFPAVNRDALLQVHCHQKSLKGQTPEDQVLTMAGIEFNEPEPGCCGMAGAFGFEATHKDVCQKIGEQNLIPAVLTAPTETLIIADGFSCREQIRQSTHREAVHLAQALTLGRIDGTPEPYPEKKLLPKSRLNPTKVELLIGAALLTSITATLVAVKQRRNKQSQ